MPRQTVLDPLTGMQTSNVNNSGSTGISRGFNRTAPFEERGRLLGSQFWDTSEKDFVGIPVDSYAKLFDKVENDYVLAANKMNEIDAFTSNLPQDDKLKPFADNIKQKVQEKVGGIGAENYATNVYNIQQAGNDLLNKEGGSHIANAMARKATEIDKINKSSHPEEIKRKLIARLDKEGWGAQLAFDADGNVVDKGFKSIEHPDYIPANEVANKLAEQVKANTTYDRQTGKLKFTTVPEGWIGLMKTEEVTEERIKEFIEKSFANDPKVQTDIRETGKLNAENIAPTLNNFQSFPFALLVK